MKKLLCIILMLASLLSCLSLNALAAASEEIMPLWDNTAHTTENMVFDNGIGTAGMRATGKNGVTYIEGIGVIYKRVGLHWEYITESSKAVYFTSCYIEIDFPAEQGCEYKAEYSFTLYKNGVGETVESTVRRTYE